jgi:hypothetical protein
MTPFQLYFTLGLQHITDWNGYDHILFLLALCAPYSSKEAKKLFLLITSFTIGHSISLALAVLGIFSVNSDYIESLIPVTIIVTAILNIIRKPTHSQFSAFLLAVFFGLVHGLGFSNYLRTLLGGEASLFTPLLSFNLGLEAGQLIIVAVIFIVTSLVVQYLRLSHKIWTILVSLLTIAVGISLLIGKI